MSVGLCANGTLLLDGGGCPVRDGVVVAARCGSWGCPECGPRKARAIRIRLVTALNEVYLQEVAWLRQQHLPERLVWRPFKLLTLTIDVQRRIAPERYEAWDWQATPQESAEARHDLLHGWNALHSWLVWLRTRQPRTRPPATWERTPSRVPFFWTLEYTAQGWPHLHVIVVWRERIDALGTLRALWDKYGLGLIVDLRNSNWTRSAPLGLASYLTKSLARSLTHGSYGARRWSCSRGFLPPKSVTRSARQRGEERAGWSPLGVERHRQERWAAGAHITEVPGGFRWALDGAGSWPSMPFTHALRATASRAPSLVATRAARPLDAPGAQREPPIPSTRRTISRTRNEEADR